MSVSVQPPYLRTETDHGVTAILYMLIIVITICIIDKQHIQFVPGEGEGEGEGLIILHTIVIRPLASHPYTAGMEHAIVLADQARG